MCKLPAYCARELSELFQYQDYQQLSSPHTCIPISLLNNHIHSYGSTTHGLFAGSQPLLPMLATFLYHTLAKKTQEPEQGYRALPRHQSTMPVQRHQSPFHSPLSGGAKTNITLMELTSVQHYLWFMMRLCHGTRKLSSFHQGKAFITELACLFEAFTMEKALEGISFKEAITIPMLLL